LNTTKQQVWEQCDVNRQEFLDFLRELICVSAQGESDIQNIVSEKLQSIGLEVDNIDYLPQKLSVRQEFADPSTVDSEEHTSVVGKLSGNSANRSLMLFAQGDTMPVDGGVGWERKPFDPVIEDGRLYGWCVSDDLVGVASMIYAIKSILDVGVKPKGDVIVASTPSKHRARGIIAVLEKGYETDAVVYVHPAETGVGLEEIKQATAGLLSFRVTVPGRLPDTGEPGHTSFHHKAIDPLEKAVIVIQALQSLNVSRGKNVRHALYEEAIGRSTNLHIAHIRCGEEKVLNRVSPECVLAGSVTLIPGEDLSDVQQQIAEVVHSASNSDPWLKEHPPILDWLVGTHGAEVSMDHPLYQTTKTNITEVTGIEPHPNPLHTASDIRNPMLFNDIPTVGLGPKGGGLTQTGKHDEWVDVDESVMTIKVLAGMIMDWCEV